LSIQEAVPVNGFVVVVVVVVGRRWSRMSRSINQEEHIRTL
jgi:hypothetical protein